MKVPSSKFRVPKKPQISNIEIFNRQRAKRINLHRLKKIATGLLVELKIQNADLGINLVAALEMTALNGTFLHHAGSTDVITFDYSVGQVSRPSHFSSKRIGDRPEACPALSGEIFICVDEALAQARKFKTSWQSEIVRYLIHGVLHLTGHDDSPAGERRKMKREEDRLLRQLSRRFSLAELQVVAKLPACISR